jgi:hypothetical protein
MAARARPVTSVAAIAIVALTLSFGASAATPPVERVVISDRGDLYLVAPANGSRDRLTRTSELESEPALSPDGARVAFVREGRILLLPTRAAGRALAVGAPSSSSPSWSPDGTRLVVAGADGLAIVSVADGAATALPGAERGRQPAWAPDGATIAFARDGDLWSVPAAGGTATQLVADPAEDSEPAWSPDGARLAFVRGAVGARDVWTAGATETSPGPLAAAATPGDEVSPAFSPDGDRLAFVRSGSIFLAPLDGSATQRLGPGVDPAWGRIPPPPSPPTPPPPRPDELLPDLDQRAPAGVTISVSERRFLLGFTSATDNVGRGPIWIRGRRPSPAHGPMSANQLIRLVGGGVRVVRDVGLIRYTWSPSHSHWHLLRFQSYELRRASDYRLLVRDRKSGFCLADHWGLARHRVRGFTGAHFLGNCGQGRPDLLSVEQGTSIGYTDRYPAHFHGQNVDVTGLPPGIYVLVHRADPLGRLRERTRTNNSASARIRLTWPNGHSRPPRVAVLRRCESRERC